MLNDPLLPTGSVPPPPRAPKRARRPKPATSAKILATGLSTTAMLGMTTGYALAGRTVSPEPDTTLPSGTTGAVTGAILPAAPTAPTAPTPATTPAEAPSMPTATAPVVTAPVITAPVVTAAPEVVDVPVPASPGNGGGGWNTQQSGGSH